MRSLVVVSLFVYPAADHFGGFTWAGAELGKIISIIAAGAALLAPVGRPDVAHGAPVGQREADGPLPATCSPARARRKRPLGPRAQEVRSLSRPESGGVRVFFIVLLARRSMFYWPRSHIGATFPPGKELRSFESQFGRMEERSIWQARRSRPVHTRSQFCMRATSC